MIPNLTLFKNPIINMEKPFGLAYPRPEGTPVHPDDWIPSNLTDVEYEIWREKQLKAYNEYWGIKDADNS